MNNQDSYRKLDIILGTSLDGVGGAPGDRELLNWYEGRALGAIRMAEYLGLIPSEASDLLRDVVSGWYHYYLGERA